MMYFGLKLWSQNPSYLFDEAIVLQKKGVIDFLELYIVPHSFDQSQFEKLKQIPITIHATHELHGLNLAQDNNHNRELLREVFCFADFLNADRIVLHPGSNGNFETTIKHLYSIKDKRILIENMPAQVVPELGTGACIGASIDEVQQMLNFGFGLCLDFGHAIAASVALKIPYKEYIMRFFALSPFYFHVSDGHVDIKYDEHMNLGEGEIDYRWIKSQLEALTQARVVFETPKEGNNLKNDIKNMEYFRKL